MPEQKKAVIPRLRFPEFRDAGPWEVKRLGEVCDVLQGYGFPHRFQGKQRGKYPFCKVSDVTRAVVENGGHITSAANYIDEEDLLALRAQPLPPGTTIFARIGEALRSNNRAITDVSCVIDNNVCGLKALQDIAIDYFVFCLAQRIDLNEHCGGAVPSVNKTTIESIKVAIPGAGEQQKIAECLSSLDEVIELEAKQLEALQAHKKGLMQQLFPREGETTPRLRFPEFRDAGPWEMKRLGDLATRIAEKVGSRRLIPVSISAGIGFVSQKEKFGRDISGRQYQNYIRLKKWQFSYNKGHSKAFPQGAVYQLREFDEAAVPKAFYSFEFKSNYVPEFFIGYFASNFHGTQLAKFVTSSARSDGLLNISADDFFSIMLPTPRDTKEQQKIADCLSSLDELIELQAKQLEALQAHKKGLMQQLFPQEIDL